MLACLFCSLAAVCGLGSGVWDFDFLLEFLFWRGWV
jgi:hypothetical protein